MYYTFVGIALSTFGTTRLNASSSWHLVWLIGHSTLALSIFFGWHDSSEFPEFLDIFMIVRGESDRAKK